MPASSAKSPVAILNSFKKGSLSPKPMSAFLRLVFAIASEGNDPVAAMRGIEGIEANFIDWNECRVARWVEIARAMDPLPNADKIAMRIKDMLNRLFDRKGMLTLDFCIELKLTEAKKLLNELDLMLPKQEVGMILYYYHPTMTLPVTPEGLEVAKKYGLIAKSGDKSHLQKVFAKLEHQEALELLHYLELEAVTGNPEPVSEESTATKAAATKKVAKKKTTKKKVVKKV